MSQSGRSCHRCNARFLVEKWGMQQRKGYWYCSDCIYALDEEKREARQP